MEAMNVPATGLPGVAILVENLSRMNSALHLHVEVALVGKVLTGLAPAGV